MLFPKRNISSLNGMIGETFFQYFVNEEMNCIYHKVDQENDFGIDGYIELVENGNVSGKLIGVQIKHGDSFFRSKTLGGYKYIGENKHLNYYLNSQSPIFIVILDQELTRMNWVQFKIEKTMPLQEKRWWIEVPKENKLKYNFKNAIFETAGPIIDFEEQIQMNWAIANLIKNSDYITLAVTKDEIENESFDFINNFIDGLCRNKEMLLDSKSSLDIFFPEYEEDSREIFQIPEIMQWLKKSIEIGIPWFYFLNNKWKNAGLSLLFHAYCISASTMRIERGFLVKFNNDELAKFFEINFYNMNNFMEQNGIDEEFNVEITEGIVTFFEEHMITIE
ncbi:DUF4365 and DUF1817 domain-containing protein [Clostridium sp. MSJ-11]|uniref:DUF4365 and DUF1817 domain-containing protein n=1 Tax=Clostridium mobile TaxID=2841512 RepID=A0ABS6EDQ3_9CLOT|nr:DUF4365 and DUF1817 domain-containing protein [Clostridium mobile]MBU5483332.1 DUF4365 and DUF1817 domain-containing protein [Clostridium mobile]